MVKVLVTGARGQLGSELRRLPGSVAADYEWVFTDTPEMDITDGEATVARLKIENPGVIVNCAAFTDVDGAEKNRAAAFAVNAAGVGALAAWAVKSGAVLVHISTDFVFDGAKGEPYTEDDVPAPLNVYGESKLAGERAVLDSGCRGAVARTSWLYSPYGRNFVKSIIGAAARNREIKVVCDQWGSPTAAAGLACAVAGMIPRLLETAGAAELYHYCDGGVVSRSGFAERIVELSGSGSRIAPVRSRDCPQAARRPGFSALDTSKITRVFGIVPRRWEDALAESLAEIETGLRK